MAARHPPPPLTANADATLPESLSLPQDIRTPIPRRYYPLSLFTCYTQDATYQISAPLARAPLTRIALSDTLSRRPVGA